MAARCLDHGLVLLVCISRSFFSFFFFFFLLFSAHDHQRPDFLISEHLASQCIFLFGAGSPPILISPVVSHFYTNERHMANIKSKA